MATTAVISVSTVHPECPNKSAQRIELTPWDLQVLLVDYIQRGLLFPKPTAHRQKDFAMNVIDHLKTSLSRTLHYFFPLAGRLATTKNLDGTTSFFLHCNGAGAHFIHAAAHGVAVAHILDPVYTPRIVHSFFPLNGVLNYEGTSKPLLAVQVTELVDGVFIGCSVNHVVVDGTSFWHFFNSWTELSRGFDRISRPPLLDRCFLDDSRCPISLPFPYDENPFPRSIPPSLQERFFHFGKERIALLKAKANAEIGTNCQISSLQALLAHLWRAVVRARQLHPDQEISYVLLVGMRPRLKPPLPEEYFGNAVRTGTVTIKAGELLKQGPGYAAWQMNKMIALQKGDETRKLLDSWAKSPELLTVSSTGVKANSLLTGSSPRFNVYGNDFGWGRPLAVRNGVANRFDGKLTVFPGVEEGSVDVEACLSAETLEAMGEDAEFMDAVTI